MHAYVFQGRNLSLFADAVVIEVAPNAEFIKDAVGSIHFAIAVFIQFGQGGKTMRGGCAVFEQGVVAEKLAAVVDFAVAIAVIHQNTVVAVHPASPGADATAFVIEQCAVMTIGSKGFETVVIQVEGYGIKLGDQIITRYLIVVIIIVLIPSDPTIQTVCIGIY